MRCGLTTCRIRLHAAETTQIGRVTNTLSFCEPGDKLGRIINWTSTAQKPFDLSPPPTRTSKGAAGVFFFSHRDISRRDLPPSAFYPLVHRPHFYNGWPARRGRPVCSVSFLRSTRSCVLAAAPWTVAVAVSARGERCPIAFVRESGSILRACSPRSICYARAVVIGATRGSLAGLVRSRVRASIAGSCRCVTRHGDESFRSVASAPPSCRRDAGHEARRHRSI